MTTQHAADSSTTPPIINLAAYQFATLENLTDLRGELKALCEARQLKGTILLSPEGINLFVAGARESVDQLLIRLRQIDGFADLTVKESLSDEQPFNRMLVRLKKEIIAFGVEGIAPANHTSEKITPSKLKKWLDEGQPFTLLDTRNDYEIQLGTFEGAIDLGIDHFREFPDATNRLPEELKQQPVVMFCTGGIRCEKAGPYLERQGFENVLQLDGGILNYFEQIGGEHWQGECFVFDQRVSVDPRLAETPTTECFVCKAALSEQDQQSERYVVGESCPHCYVDAAEKLRTTIAAREAAISRVTDPLPGGVPYDNERPTNVPLKYDWSTLLDFLDQFHPHIGREEWQRRCAAGRITWQREPADAARVVRAGERYVHHMPSTIEPDVNAAIKIVFEDERLIVVNKPAPLPMHPSGRFNRNTLGYILNEVYSPERLRPAHRLDANTSGLVVLSRTRAIAARVQPLFESGAIAKTYLARVVGHAEHDTFESRTPIGAEAQQAGLRLPDPTGLPAHTQFRVLQRLDDGTTLLEVQPLTGRTNQIRLHLWDLGMPVVGDPSYLPEHSLAAAQTLSPEADPMCLHAWRLAFIDPFDQATRQFEASAPGWANIA